MPQRYLLSLISPSSFPDFSCSFAPNCKYMPPNLHIRPFLDPVNLSELSQDQGYKDGQIGKQIDVYDEFFPDVYDADLVIVGFEAVRGAARSRNEPRAPKVIRQPFYQLLLWQADI